MKCLKRYKAIMHFNKPGSRAGTAWTIHYRNVCHLVNTIECNVPMKSEWKPLKKSNPRAFFVAMAESVTIVNGVGIIS